MTTKKKLIRIEPVDGLYKTDDVYAHKVSSNISFAFVGPGEEVRDGVKYKKQISCFYTCREQLVEVPRMFLHKQPTISGYDFTKSDVDMSRIRLLIAGRGTDDIKQRIFSAKRAINQLEEAAGWDKSVITSVKHTHFKDEENKLFLLTGPEQWVRLPQMVSLIALILRLGYKFGPFEAATMKDVHSTFKEIAKYQGSRQSDHEYISGCRKHLITLMKALDKVFPEGSERYYVLPKSSKKGWNGCAGITTLFKGSTGYDKLNKTFREHVLDVKK